jgi:catechol 2,3-dioxygenase-like lactoylglutathione lyase family enzyme
MPLHALTSITIGVPNPAETRAYYTEFGLTPDGGEWFATRDGGRQLRILPAHTRRLIEVRVGVDDPDDLSAAAARLARLDVPCEHGPRSLTAHERATGVRAILEIAPRLEQTPVPATAYNGR